jgi:hypothetical protein
MKYVHLLAAVIVIAANTHAQEADSSSVVPVAGSCSITIQSTPDSAALFLDGVRRGNTPVTLDSLSAGRHGLRLQHPAVDSWLTVPISDTITLAYGDYKTFSYSFTNRFIIDTDPFDAEILVGDSALGHSPFLVTSPLSVITLRKVGFRTTTLDLVPVTGGVFKATLHPEWETGGSFPLAIPFVEQKRSPLRLYLTGAATVLSGTAAAYFKIKADDTYQQYLITGNNSDRARVRELDRSAAIALVATQLGLALFTYFIFTQ